MGASKNAGVSGRGTGPPWVDVLLSAVVAVSWALIGMAGTAALGLHLLGADETAALGPMSAAVVALGVGGSVTPSGDVSAFGLTGAEAATAVDVTPLGVGLVGALLLAWLFLRSLRAAGDVIAPSELLARAGTVVALFVAMLGGLAWAGHDVVTIDGGALGLDDVPGAGGGVEVPGLGDIGGLLPDRIGDLVGAEAAVGFTVDTAPTLLGGLAWCVGVLLIALLASRRTPLPRGWDAVHRVVRPAVSALVTVLLVAVAAGFAAAAWAAVGDDHPKRIAGAALLGAPNGVWLGVPIGLFVPFDGRATGPLTRLLPDPLDDLLTDATDRSVTLGRLAELDGRVWLLGVAAALMMLLAGVLTAARTPVGGRGGGWKRGAARFAGRQPVAGAEGARDPGALGFAGHPGAGAGGAPEPGASRSARQPVAGAGDVRDPGTLGFAGPSVAGPGGVRDPGALRFAGRCALRLGTVTALALALLVRLTAVSADASLSVLGFDAFGASVELRGSLAMALLLGAAWGAGAGAVGALAARLSGAAGVRAARLALAGTDAEAQAGAVYESGPYRPGTPYRPPNPATNPYLRVPEELREPEDARPPGAGPSGQPGSSGRTEAQGGAGASGGARNPEGAGPPEPPPPRDGDVYGAPTVVRPIEPPRRRSPGTEDGPPPPPPPPGTPGGRR
ncbi:streptophobe family protein [Streptomyces sp. JHA19]|uniref:streptophobe family protein n=1 Tax=Streptomyces sp. JHA19 TaxID=1577588 RepID=UPI0006E32D22|nr:streptophobe family protein [Streptomyces sp. JHA19]